MIWLILDDHGCVEEMGVGSAPPEGATVVDSLPEDLGRMLWVPPCEVEITDEGEEPRWERRGGWMPRPELPAPVATEPGFTVTDLPEGAQVEVIDTEAGVSMAVLTPDAQGAVDVSLPDAARYRICVTGPSPWAGGEYTIERTDE